MMPAHPTAHFIVAQTDFPFGLLQQLLYAVTLALDPRQLMELFTTVGVAERVIRRRLLVQCPHHQQSFVRSQTTVFLLGLHPRFERLDPERAFFASTDRDRFPARRRLPRRPDFGPFPRWPVLFGS